MHSYRYYKTRGGWLGVRAETGSNGSHFGDQSGQTQISKTSGFDCDFALTALLEYFILLAHTSKVQSCYLFSYCLAS